jgi:hypothetical protein
MTKSKAIKAIKRAFDEQDITIPFHFEHWNLRRAKNSQMELNMNGVSKEDSTNNGMWYLEYTNPCNCDNALFYEI